MSKHLVIVESPAKAKTIHKFLGKDYTVKACMGHIRDLPKTQLGIDIDKDFAPRYAIIPAKSALVKELRSYANKADKVFLATDLDREGEAIAWHLSQALKLPQKKTARVIFNEITKNAIKAAFGKPGEIQLSKVYAQQARRTLDRLVGYQLSPLLWEKIARRLSAGRVQSVAVKLIVEREKEIQAFQSEEYWKIIAKLALQKGNREVLDAELRKINGKKALIPNEKKSSAILKRLEGKQFTVADITRKQKSEKALPPFTTSQLQQQASTKLRFRTQHTMSIAQQLYEGLELGTEGPIGLITYMRTDSVQVSKEAIDECRDYIAKNYSSEYLPKKANVYRNKKAAQGAHEAIRPSSATRTPDSLKNYLSHDQYRLYKLIWQRFVASQMQPAKNAFTTISIQADNCTFEVKGKQVIFRGYTILQQVPKEEKLLPMLEQGDELDLRELMPSQHFTQPAPRFTEATLVKTLEAKGIGRPSTYAAIIGTIQARGYVKLQERKFFGTDLGIKVTEQLSKFFTGIMDYNFTAGLESELDQIEEAKENWTDVLKKFYRVFSMNLQNAYEKMDNIKKNPEVSEYSCDACGASLIYRYNKQGKFLGCSSFPACKNTVPLDREGKPIFPIITDYKCDKCGNAMVLRQGKSGKFLGCSSFPECVCTLPVGLDGKPIVPTKTDTPCPECGELMLKKQGSRGQFLACSNYPQCKKTLSLSSTSDMSKLVKAKCEICDKPMAIRQSRKGVFLGCTGYPNCKNIKKFSTDLLRLPPEFCNIKCEMCGNSMLLRAGRKGFFWGCSKYPKCDATVPCDLNDIAAHCQDLPDKA